MIQRGLQLSYEQCNYESPLDSRYKTVRLTSALTRVPRRWGQRIAAGQVVTPIVLQRLSAWGY